MTITSPPFAARSKRSPPCCYLFQHNFRHFDKKLLLFSRLNNLTRFHRLLIELHCLWQIELDTIAEFMHLGKLSQGVGVIATSRALKRLVRLCDISSYTVSTVEQFSEFNHSFDHTNINTLLLCAPVGLSCLQIVLFETSSGFVPICRPVSCLHTSTLYCALVILHGFTLVLTYIAVTTLVEEAEPR